MQIDSTPIDVLVLLDSGVPVRADLTIVVDVATRTICAAVLRPVGTRNLDDLWLDRPDLGSEPQQARGFCAIFNWTRQMGVVLFG